MNLKHATLAAATLVLALSSAWAQPITPEQAVLNRLTSLYPSTTFKSVKPTPIDNIFEVVMGRNVAYVDASGRYFMMGHLVDMPLQKDLTDEVLADARRIRVNELPLGDAIKTVKGQGRRTLVIFTDPDCPYCRNQEEILKLVNDVTIYTFLMPIASLHPDAPRKASMIWCADDRKAAWDDFMLGGKLPANQGACENPIQRNLQLAKSLGAEGTPTLINATGDINVGRMSLAALEKFLGTITVGSAK